jgi:hypothetical protein
MKRWSVRLAVLLTVLLARPAAAQGQFVQQPGVIGQPPVNPFSRPPVSPYVNLFRGGNPAINYYGLVRPEQQQLQLQQQVLQQQQELRLAEAGGLGASNALPLQTGHGARFNSYNQYFNSVNRPNIGGR